MYNKKTIDLQYVIKIYGAAIIEHCNLETINKVVPALETGSHIICPIDIEYTINDMPVLDGFEQLKAEQYGPNNHILEDHLAGRCCLPWRFTNTPHPRGKPVK